MGGFFGEPSAINESYDPSLDQFTTKTAVPTARSGMSATELNGLIFAIGGLNTSLTYVPNVDVFNPAGAGGMGSWTTTTSLSVPRYFHAAALANGKIYVFGGYNNQGTTTSVEAFDPATATWSPRASMPTKRYRCSAGVVNGKIYVIGGSQAASPFTTNEMYDPLTDTWTSKAPLPVGTEGGAVAVVADKIFYVGGFPGFDPTNDVWIYDASTDTWKIGPNLAATRGSVSAGVYDSKIYALGGIEETDFAIPHGRNEALDAAFFYIMQKN